MITYADYTFYSSDYRTTDTVVLGTVDFTFYERDASQIIKKFTFDNIQDAIPDEVKCCACELAEYLYNLDQKKEESTGKTSEKVGDYSVNYESQSTVKENSDAEIYQIIQKWLADTGLTYRGVRRFSCIPTQI